MEDDDDASYSWKLRKFCQPYDNFGQKKN